MLFRRGNRKTQYSETIVMHVLFNLLRIKDLYMFRALLAHPQEALNKRNLVYYVRVMSVGCTRVEVELVSPTPYNDKMHSVLYKLFLSV
jgi:hypothetical protein